jgi:HK97 gp10 family phage protein
MSVLSLKFKRGESPEKIVAKLGRLDKKLQNKFITKGLRAGGKITLRTARQNARTSLSGEGTGAMARGLKVRVKSLKRQLKGVKALFITSPTREKLASLNPNYDPNRKNGYYPAVQEYGSSKINVPAKNFMRDAFKSTQARFQRVFMTKVWQLIKGEVAR